MYQRRLQVLKNTIVDYYSTIKHHYKHMEIDVKFTETNIILDPKS